MATAMYNKIILNDNTLPQKNEGSKYKATSRVTI